MTNNPQIPFQRGVVQPVECLKAGFNLMRDQYWLFVGMCAVAMMIGSAVPLGILMGPMMCGLYLAFFRVRRGLPIEFGTLFKGFDYFGQSVVAALLHVIPITAVVIAAYIFLYVGMFAAMIAASAAGENAAPFAGIGIFHALLHCDFPGRHSHLDRIYICISVDRRSRHAGLRRGQVKLARGLRELLEFTRHVFARRPAGNCRHNALLRRNISRVSNHPGSSRCCIRTSIWLK